MNKVLYRETDRLTGDTSGLYGEASVGLSGDVTGLIGDCTHWYGDCTGVIGDLDSIPRREVPRSGVPIWTHVTKHTIDV
jgi:hypothetical protein